MSIHQERVLPATAEAVFAALATGEGHTALTGVPATGSPEAGAAWTAYGGGISGRNIEVIPGRRLVQAWRAGNWPEGFYSVVRFELTPEGDGVRLGISHHGYPPEGGVHLEQGWKDNYWDKLAAAFPG